MADVAENLSATHKVAYANGLPTLLPEQFPIQKDIKFDTAKKLGDYYEEAVRLSLPGGFTHKIADGTAGAFALNDAVGGSQKKAKVYAYQFVLRDLLSYEDAAKAKGGSTSYVEATSFFWEGLQMSMRKRNETVLLHGQKGLGTIGTYTSGDPSIVVTTSEWAPQIWAGIEGTYIDVMSGTSGTVRGTVYVTKVDIENKKIWLSGTVSGATAGDVLYFKGNYGQEAIGMHTILTNTGTLMNIDAGTFSSWKATQQAAGSAKLSFTLIKKALGKSVGKGNMFNMKLYANPGGFEDLTEDIQQLRNIDKSEVRRVEIGNDQVVYKSQGVTLEVIPHPMMKEGYAMGVIPELWHRVGAVDLQVGDPAENEKIFFNVTGVAGYEARMYTNQAIYSEWPGVNFLISGIVNTI